MTMMSPEADARDYPADQTPDVDLDEAPLSADEVFSGSLPIREALERLRLRLLDLTGRNRLLNFKPTAGKSLQFVEGIPELVYRRLVSGSGASGRILLTPIPEPERDDWVMKNERLVRPEAREYAASKGISTTYDQPRPPAAPGNGAGSSLRALHFPDDLAKHGRKLEREARLAIEETGSNMLYLVFGFLEFPDTADSDKLYLAPLVSVPVRMERVERGQYTDFFLVATGEEIEDNLSLREKIKRDYGLLLPAFDDFEERDDLAGYFAAIEKAIANRPRWQLRRRVTLALLSFSNMLLVRDLDPEKWPERVSGKSALLDHPIVRQVFQGARHERGESAEYSDEYPIDEHPKVQLPVVYDVDSSQHSALIDVLDGRNLVIEGPPGTGKSQTITNLIAAAIQSGKKVLFVSEKLAALEVVKSRLAHAGLEDFILELHSNKTSKAEVLASLRKRHELSLNAPAALPNTLNALERRRSELKCYVDTMRAVEGNRQGLKVYQVLGRSELYRQKAGTDAARELPYEAAPDLTADQFDALYARLVYVARVYVDIGCFDAQHPFWGFFPFDLQPQHSLTVERILANAMPGLRAFAAAMRDTAAFLNAEGLPLPAEEAQRLLRLLVDIAPASADEVAFDCLPRLFTDADPQGHDAAIILADLQGRLQEWARNGREMAGTWISNATVTDVALAPVAEAQSLLQALDGLALSVNDLRRAQLGLQAATTAARRSLAELQAIAPRAGLVFDGTVAGLRRLQAVLEMAEAAPVELLHLRHADLASPQAPALLARAAAGLADLKARRQALDARFYIDMKPAEEVLREAILVLREGSAWYRVLQPRWYRAMGVHKRLQREKVKKTAGQRLAELEELFAHDQQTRAWNSDEALRRHAGAAFAGEATPLAELHQVAEWLVSRQRLLDEARCTDPELNPLAISLGRLAELRERREQALNAGAGLPALPEVLVQEFPQGREVVNSRLWMEGWDARIAEVEAMTLTLGRLLDLLEPNVAPSATLAQALAALRARHRQPRLVAEIAGHAAAQQLMGARFAAEHSDLEPVQAALTYGRLVKAVGLPAPVEAVLLAEASPDNYGRLCGLLGDVGRGWEALAAFVRELGQVGTVVLGQWAQEEAPVGRAFAEAVLARAERARASLAQLQPWGQYLRQREEARKEQLLPFVELMERGALHPTQLADAFGHRFYASIANMLFESNPVLRVFGGSQHSKVREEYAELDRKLIRMRGQQIAADTIAAAQSRLPAGVNGIKVDDKTEMALLQYLMPQTRPRMAVRKILQRAGRAIQELKPCFMLGPQSVAQYLTSGHLEFDLVVMDEASQLKPEQAIGAIARGRQLVVVGDPKQLPPTSFFSRLTATDGDESAMQAATDEAESILDVCIGHFQPIRSLRWHYRSKHESLIAFSNQAFYGGKLLIFPSPWPRGGALGVRYHYLPEAVYDNQMNVAEARCVVDAVVEHMKTRPDDSLGVVTLNIKQRELIAELLEERLRGMIDMEALRVRWEERGQPMFVKNLENVQGDERDCIMISTTFGRAPGVSRPRQNFGPISRDGGWRRLNVLFTRARKSIAVYSSLRPEDIVVDHTSPAGTRALRHYLEYAATGVLAAPKETGQVPDSEFEEAVIRLLERKGYRVTPQLGVASFRIDIAVNHPEYPGTYIAAIECDGATYHSGVSVRDRDRIRQEILESQGWKGKIWRIWSTDWFRNPDREAAKLFSFLEERLRAQVPAEYIVPRLPVPSVDVTPVNFVAAEVLETLPDDVLIEEDDDEMEVSVGDTVTYRPAEAPEDQAMTMRITAKVTNLEQGLIAENLPLAQALLGAQVGGKATLRVPGKPEQVLIVMAIKRERAG